MQKKIITILIISTFSLTSIAQNNTSSSSSLQDQSFPTSRVKKIINRYNTERGEYIRTASERVLSEYQTSADREYFDEILRATKQIKMDLQIEVINNSIKISLQNKSFKVLRKEKRYLFLEK